MIRQIIEWFLNLLFGKEKYKKPHQQDDHEVRELIRNIESGRTGQIHLQPGYVPEPPTAKLPFIKKQYFFTSTERKFFMLLQNIASKNNLCVFSKVRFEDLLSLPKMEIAQKMHFRGKVRSRHVDFVLCDNKYFQPRLVIELDDWRHKYANRKEVDDYKDKALQDAGLPILRIPVATYYDVRDLETSILSFIQT